MLVHFLDGTTHETDVVIGADGIKSAVRDHVSRVDPVSGVPRTVAYSHNVSYRGLIPHGTLKAAGFSLQLTDRPGCFIGSDKVSTRSGIYGGEAPMFR